MRHCFILHDDEILLIKEQKEMTKFMLVISVPVPVPVPVSDDDVIIYQCIKSVIMIRFNQLLLVPFHALLIHFQILT